MGVEAGRIRLLEKAWAICISLLTILFSAMMSITLLAGGLAIRYQDGEFFLQQGRTIRSINQVAGALYFSTVALQFLVLGVTAALTAAVFLRHATYQPREVFRASVPEEERYLMLMLRSCFSLLIPSVILLAWAIHKVFFE